MEKGDGKPPGVPFPNLSRRSLLIGAGGVSISPALLRAAVPGSSARVAVIGAGTFGAWTAEHLRRSGHKVTLVDMAGPANSRASSGGDSRMTRGAYGKDAVYTRMALDSLKEWKALSATAGLPIFTPCGVLFFFPSEEAYLTDSIAAHEALGLPTELLDGAAMTRRFPMIDFTGIHAGIYEPGFGALMARRAVQTLVKNFVGSGGEYRQELVQAPQQDGALKSVKLASGTTLEADEFIFALGPWLPKYFPGLLGNRIFTTRQEIFYFAPPEGDRRFLPNVMPGWADFNAGDMYYGFPDLEARGVKFAHDQHGVAVDPDTQSREHTQAALDEVISFRDRRFPLLKGAPVLGAEVCQYENSSNGDFLIDRHPTMTNVVLVGGGSGHGFKHGPEVGRMAATLVSVGGAQTEPRFSLATKGETQRREVH
jgi:glycine/D-amino acid oxidase-like deaminating enzyme